MLTCQNKCSSQTCVLFSLQQHITTANWKFVSHVHWNTSTLLKHCKEESLDIDSRVRDWVHHPASTQYYFVLSQIILNLFSRFTSRVFVPNNRTPFANSSSPSWARRQKGSPGAFTDGTTLRPFPNNQLTSFQTFLDFFDSTSTQQVKSVILKIKKHSKWKIVKQILRPEKFEDCASKTHVIHL